MRKEKSRDAARSRRSKENHEFYELAKLLPLPAAITSQLDFLDKASIIRLTISFLKLRQFSVNGHPPWAPDFTTLGSVNPYSYQATPSTGATSGAGAYSSEHSSNGQQLQQEDLSSPSSVSSNLKPAPQINAFSAIDHLPLAGDASKNPASLFEIHQGTHILQSLDGFAFAIGRDGRFLYISETVSMYLGLSQVEMTGSSVFDYTHQQDHEELARQLGIAFSDVNSLTMDTSRNSNSSSTSNNNNLNQNNIQCESPPPASVHSQYSAASNETSLEDYVNANGRRKRIKTQPGIKSSSATASNTHLHATSNNNRNGKRNINPNLQMKSELDNDSRASDTINSSVLGVEGDPHVRQFCIRMKSTLTKRGCQHFKSSGYRVVHVVGHLRSYQSNDHGHLMDPLDETCHLFGSNHHTSVKSSTKKTSTKSAGSKSAKSQLTGDTGYDDDEDTQDDNQQQLNKQVAGCTTKPKIIGMVAVAIALPPPSINEMKLESDTFVFRLSLDLRVTHIEPKITELLNYPVEMIAGKSLYSLVHPADVHQLERCHQELLRKGQIMSGYYRLLARTGGYIWIHTCATMICNNTLSNQSSAAAAVAANSPLPAQVASTSAGSNQDHHHLHKIPSFMLPSGSADNLATVATVASQYGAGHVSSANLPKMASPSLTGADPTQIDQDQCVIFVNYMITNVVESGQILDMCQSDQPYVPPATSGPVSSLSSAFSGISPTTIGSNSSTNTSNTMLFNSPSSSCSSPCLTAAAAAAATSSNKATQNHRQHHSSNYNASPSAHSNSLVTAAQAGAASLTTRQHRHNGEMSHNKSKSINGRRVNHQTKTSTKASPYSSLKLQADNLLTQDNYNSKSNDVDTSASIYAGYSQTPVGVNLALAANKMHGQVNQSNSWLTDPSSRAAAALAANPYAGASADPYSTVNRSIYKAAFGLDVASAGYSHQHQHQASVYSNSTGASYSSQITNPSAWDTATVAAVAAASHQQHLADSQHSTHHLSHSSNSHQSGHLQHPSQIDTSTSLHHNNSSTATTHHQPQQQHQHQQTHQQMHPQQQHPLHQVQHPNNANLSAYSAHQTASHSLSSAAAATGANTHHHATAAATTPYYNYYGYYGNKFI